MALHASNPAPFAARQQLEMVPDLQRTLGQSPRHHGAGASNRERPVDPQPRPVTSMLNIGHTRREFFPQPIQTLTRSGRYGDDRCPFQRGAHQLPRDLDLDFCGDRRVDGVDLGQGDDSRSDAKEIEHGQMLFGLRHPALVGGHDEQCDVDGLDPGEHVLQEPLVPGHVDERDLARGSECGPGEPEIDGQPAFLLFGPAVGVTSCERLDQGRLAVVDMARGPDQRQPATMSAITSSSSSATARRSRIRSFSILRVSTGWLAPIRRPWRWSSSFRTI